MGADQTGVLTEGALTQTGIATDFGIRGAGFFLVRNTNSSELFATRAGMFRRDAAGFLVTYQGERLQGCSDAGLSVAGDVRVDETGGSGAAFASFVVHADGTLVVSLTDGSSFVRGQIRLFQFAHPQLLLSSGLGLYAGVEQAQPQAVASGQVQQARVELVNIPADLLALRQKWYPTLQGLVVSDGQPLHVAIQGPGFFVLRNPIDNTLCVTRLGAFVLTAGYVLAANGWRLQGYGDEALSISGDLRIDSDADGPGLSSYGFDEQGKISVTLQDGTVFVRGQILLQNFQDPSLLASGGDGCYSNLAAAGPLPTSQAPGSAGVGRLLPLSLDLGAGPRPLTPLAQSGMRLEISGEPGNRWTIQASTNLVAWTPIYEETNASDVIEYVDTDSQAYPCRFYRVMVQGL